MLGAASEKLNYAAESTIIHTRFSRGAESVDFHVARLDSLKAR